jgi:tyrosinase
MADLRREQSKLSADEWRAFIGAVNALHGNAAARPRYRDFVQVHVDAMSPVGMSWSVHSMSGMVGINFLAWHRQYLRQLELRLQKVDPSVTIPYWDWIANPALPGAINTPTLLNAWSVTRSWDPSHLPLRQDITALNLRRRFAPFQRFLEQIHNNVYLAVGGTMGGASSPADPIFFLHHANVDRLWAVWQKAHPRAKPANASERLQPAPLFGVTVSSVLSVSRLGYSYG